LGHDLMGVTIEDFGKLVVKTGGGGKGISE